MPELDGWGLAERLKTEHADLPFGFITGWGDEYLTEMLSTRRALAWSCQAFSHRRCPQAGWRGLRAEEPCQRR